jgi:hypothetical protein
MDVDTVECPVCDQKIPVDAVRCPKCNAVFSLSDVEELKKVAREINDPVTADKPSVDKPPIGRQDEGSGVAGKKSGLLGKLFGKKK